MNDRKPRLLGAFVNPGLRRVVARRVGALLAAAFCVVAGADAAFAQSPPTMVKSFSPSTILVGQTTQMTITLTNPNNVPLTNVAFSDAFPAGLSGTAGIVDDCSATINAPGTSLSITNAVIPANGSCGVAITLTASTTGSKINTTSTVTSAEAPPGAAASATLTVNPFLAPTMVKSFSPSTILVGQTTQMTITLTNPNNVPLTNVAFSDAFPAGLSGTAGIVDDCSATINAPGTSLSITNAVIPANGSCGVAITLTASTTGAKINTTSTVTSAEAPAGTAASATLTVNPFLAPTMVKSFSPSTVAIGQASTMNFALTNPNNAPLTNVSFTDTFPAGMTSIAGTSDDCATRTTVVSATGITVTNVTIPANSSCGISLGVTASTAGAKINTTSAVTSTEAPAGAAATATLTVSVLAPPTMVKTFTPSTILVGQTTQMNITVTNPNNVPLTNAAFSDVFPAGLASTSGLVNDCSSTISAPGPSLTVTNFTIPANGSCSVAITLTASTPGTKINTTSTVTSTEAPPGAAATATLTVTTTTGPSIAKSFGAPAIPVNGSTSLTLTISNPNLLAANTGIAFTDTLPAGLVVSTPNALTSSCSGSAAATAGSSTVSLTGATLAVGASCAVTVNVTGLTPGTKSNSVTVNSNEGVGNTATASIVVLGGTTTTLVSSLNPSQVGQSVTFTATVTSGSGTPTGSVTFLDGATVLATVGLAGGTAAFATAALTMGTHSITASYAGSATFASSVSPALIQTVNTPADSLKLRALQVLVTPLEAQVSGQAISGAISGAVTEGFSSGGAFVTPSGSGVRFNFAADPEATRPAGEAIRSSDPLGSAAGVFDPAMRTSAAKRQTSPIDDDFAAMGYAGPVKAPPRLVEPREWLAWAEVRGAVLDRWRSSLTVTTTPVLYGDQVNLLAGLTRKFTPNFLAGVLAGYETFDYRSDALQGRLKGDGWTVGSYLGWRMTPDIRFEAGMAYSDVGYHGTAGTAAGSFNGHRWLFTSGLTGSYGAAGLLIEPSARVFALWERENAYTDTLGTLQLARDFATGRASGGAQVSYPVLWSPGVTLVPYAGLFGDYYFNSDNAGAAVIVAGIPTAVVLDGWSARATGGIAARFGNGGQIMLGGERAGIGGNVGLWTYRARASVPFGAK